MGNCVSSIKGKNEAGSAVTLAIIGPDNAGKTTLSTVLAGEPVDLQVSPTVGFRNVKFTLKKFDITMYDLGGGKGIRPIWKNYYNEIYGVVYMVDSSSKTRIKEARDLLRETLEHPQVSGKPLLVLANKADMDGHMEEVDIVNQLDLDQTVNANNCPSHFLMISALQSSKAKMKKIVLGGFMWLLGSIQSSIDTLEPRIKEDMRAVKETRDKEREERRERVRKQREEREREEERERIRLGLPKKEGSDEEDMGGDPFKLLDMNRLKMEENKREAEKSRREYLAAQKSKLGNIDRKDLKRIKDDANIGYSMDDTMTLPRFGQGPRFGRNANLDGLDISHSSALMSHGRSTKPTALPPLDPIISRSLDSKFNSADKKKGKKKKALGDDDTPESLDNNNPYGNPYGRNNFSRSHGLSKRYDSDREVDSMALNRDDLLRHSEWSYPVSKSYDDREAERSGRDESLGRLDFSLHGSRGYNGKEADVHDLTPRVAKPKNTKMVKAGRIDEDDLEESSNLYRNSRMSLKEYGDPRMSQKLSEYGDKYPLKSMSDSKAYKGMDDKHTTRLSGNSNANSRKWDRNYDREDSMYRKSLKEINPPNMDRFDEDDKDERDEGIEDDSDNASEELGRYSHVASRYGRFGKHDKKEPSRQNKWRDENANKRRSQYSDDDDEDEDEYRSKSTLKDTLKFSRYDDDDDDDPRQNYSKEINNLKYRQGHDYNNSYNNRDRLRDSDDDRHRAQTPDQLDQRRKKKKKNILKSNKLMPSDDEGELPMSQRYASPRLVQERGSRNTSDADTPSKGRNSRTTYFHQSSSRDSDAGPKWNLAEDLPTIDNDSRLRRNFRSKYDDSDGEDVVY